MKRLGAICASLVLAAGCSCSKKKSGGWLVGEHGLMVRVDDGEADLRPSVTDEDLHAIACRGETDAFVVGGSGTVLVTTDAGDTWSERYAGTDDDLRAVAVAAAAVVWAAGDSGTLLRSADSGDTWAALDSPDVDWTSVATDVPGRVAILGGADGSIWRATPDEVVNVVGRSDRAVLSVAWTPDGRDAIAVGEGGLALRSADGGIAWSPTELGTERTLRAVRISALGDVLLAVGDGGIVVRRDPSGDDVREIGGTLRALHVTDDGHALAVGDAGLVVSSEDLGNTWTSLSAGTSATFLAVDDLHGEPHL